MDRNGFVAVIFLFLIVPEVSNASFALQFRSLVGLAPTNNSTAATVNSTVASPVPVQNISKNELVNGDKPKKDESKKVQESNNTAKADPKSSNKTGSVTLSPPTGKDKNHQKKEGSKDKNDTEMGTTESCDKLLNRCQDQKKMVACIQGSKEVVLVQNEGESTLKVNLTIPTSSEAASKELIVPKHQTVKINISLSIGRTTKIVLNAGNGECVLQVGSVSERSFFSGVPSYSKVFTPIYGAAFLVLTALIVGGLWACCKFRKRRRLDGVPYQELEMGLPETNPAINAETAEGWDLGWDDDWDDDKAVKSPGRQHVGNISGNGLTSRSLKRDGWENDWDD